MSERPTFRELLDPNNDYYNRYIIIENKYNSGAYRVRKYPFSIKMFIRPNGYLTRSLNDFEYDRGYSIFDKSRSKRNIRKCSRSRSYKRIFFELGYDVSLNIRSL